MARYEPIPKITPLQKESAPTFGARESSAPNELRGEKIPHSSARRRHWRTELI